MALFHRRPLCFFCFLFFLSCAVSHLLSFATHSIVLGISFLAVGAAVLAVCLLRRYRIGLLTVLLSVIFVATAFLHSFLTVSLPKEKAKAYRGEHLIQMEVVSLEGQSSDHTEYIGTVTQIDDTVTKMRVNLICGFFADAAAGDRIYARVLLKDPHIAWDQKGEGILLTAYVDDPTAAYVRRTSEGLTIPSLLLSDSGWRILSDRIRAPILRLFTERLGEDQGALASGFLMGERSEMKGELLLAFRRAGLSHQMAISGLHISILLGTVEMLLRRFFVPKRIRCAAVSVLSVVFLLLTGFSLSGARSVFMLYAVYISFFVREDRDGLTSLFVAMGLIVFFSPYAAVDLGLWMSFLATLGLLTVYPLIEKAIPYSRHPNRSLRFVLRLGRTLLLLMAITIVATMFLLPVSWWFFGEISLVCVWSNLVFSPFANLYLLLLPIFLLTSGIPWLTDGIQAVVFALGEWLCAVVRFFSDISYATLSLRYSFVPIIVLLFGISMVILLIVRLRRTWLVFIPTVATVLSFCLCLTAFQLFGSEPFLYYQKDEKNNEWIAVEEGSQLSFCDISDNGWQSYHAILDYLDSSVATEISVLVLTQYKGSHASMLEYLTATVWIRTLYLPIPRTESERLTAELIWKTLADHSTSLVFYGENEHISLTDTVSVAPVLAFAKEGARMLTFLSDGKRITYLTAAALELLPESATDTTKLGETLILGSYGSPLSTKKTLTLSKQTTLRKVIYTSEDARRSVRLRGAVEEYVPPKINGVADRFSLAFKE